MSSYRSYLAEELARRIAENPRYSQRAFARDLALSPGELSEVMRGIRPLTHKSARRMARALRLSSAELHHLLSLVENEGGASEESASSLKKMSQQIRHDAFHVISDWYCLALLNLTELKECRWDESWISFRLGISRHEARTAMQRLERLQLVKIHRGHVTANAPHYAAEADLPSEAIRAYHRQILQKAAQSLDFQALDQREVSGISWALDKKHIPAIKRELSEFLDHVLSKYSQGKKSAVYHLEMAFFSLTQEAAHHHE